MLDRPTLTALGIQLPITGDDNFNARVTVRYRPAGTNSWYDALPLLRVHPETVANYTVIPQFAGSIFDLRPATAYEVQLHLTDPDGPVDATFTLNAATRAVPKDPLAPRAVSVHDSNSLVAALGAARPGDIITLANGTYPGAFSMFASGTPDNPIVVRGASQDGVVLDAGGCPGCNVFESYGSWVHLENLTLQNALQGLRFQASGAQGNVVRRVHIKNTTVGMGARDNQLDFYIADNILEGRLAWPLIATDDNLANTDDEGIIIMGQGHVVVHNRISGYSSAVNNYQTGARAFDVNNNDVLWAYNCGVKLSLAEGNVRALRNRYTNVFMGMAVQPIYGGPAYFLRNVVVNPADEQMKFHAMGGALNSDPNGVFAYNNTFVSPYNALTLQTPAVSHHFAIENNLFVGPRVESRAVTVDWEGPVDDGLFDYNGYFPDNIFAFNRLGLPKLLVSNFAGLQASGWEQHGILLKEPIFASGLVGPVSHVALMPPQDVTLASNSPALDRGVVLPNVSDVYSGAGPDLGALESGCPTPIYGPRPVGVDETNEPFGCTGNSTPPPSSGASLWSSSTTPGTPWATDFTPVTLGVKFRSDVSGSIAGIRFYKGSGNTGSHVGMLYSSTGALLAQATFSGETASGWQQVTFSSPVNIAANTTYIAAYFTSSGYAVDRPFFTSAGIDRAPLHALRSGVDGPNGVYLYGGSPQFPSQSYGDANYWVDIVFSTNSSSPPPSSTSVWSNSATPGTAWIGDLSPVTLGMKFRSDSSGSITGIRFYKGSGNTGSHVGMLYSSAGTLLAQATFSGETASGWQQVSFSSPVNIAANTTYIAAYFTSSGYAVDRPFFTSNGVDNAPLHALRSGVDGPSGMYMYGGSPQFPSQSYADSNYWVDVVFSTGSSSPPPPSSSTSVWSSSATPGTAWAGDFSPVTLGMKFRSDSNGTITGIRFYKGSGNTGSHVGMLYSSAGTLLAQATFSGETASGWQQVSFSSPVNISANTTYIAAYFTSSGYAVDRPFFTSNGVDSAPLHALRSGVDGPNGMYIYGGSPQFPSQSYADSNYWVDVLFH